MEKYCLKMIALIVTMMMCLTTEAKTDNCELINNKICKNS